MIGMSMAFRVKKAVWEFSITSEVSRVEDAELEVVEISTVGFQPNDD